MNKNIIFVGLLIIFTVIIFSVGLLVGKNLGNNTTKVKTSKEVKEEQRIVIASIILLTADDKNKTTVDVTLNDKLIETYKELINSKTVRNEILKKFPNASKVELENVQGTSILKVIYVCDNYTDEECIDIVNTYISVFKEKVEEIYKVDSINIVDGPSILTRTITKYE